MPRSLGVLGQKGMIAQVASAIQSGNHLIAKTKPFAQTVSPQAPTALLRTDKVPEQSATAYRTWRRDAALRRPATRKSAAVGGSKEWEVKVTILGP